MANYRDKKMPKARSQKSEKIDVERYFTSPPDHSHIASLIGDTTIDPNELLDLVDRSFEHFTDLNANEKAYLEQSAKWLSKHARFHHFNPNDAKAVRVSDINFPYIVALHIKDSKTQGHHIVIMETDSPDLASHKFDN